MSLGFESIATATVTRPEERNHFAVELWRAGELVHKDICYNAVTNEGKNYLLNVMFKSGTPSTTWYVGIINNSGWGSVNVADTYDAIDQAGNAWDEWASYTDTNNTANTQTRPVWNAGTVASQSLTSLTTSTIDMTANGVLKGLFIVAGANASLKSDHTAANNYLWCTTLFTAGDVTVINGDQLKVTYTATAT
jgi:hypothetical protein